MIETITFDTKNDKLVVNYEDGTTKEYTQADEYIADHPTRVADAVAMGWEVPVVETPVEIIEEQTKE